MPGGRRGKVGKDMRLLVTGGAGFIGSNFIRYILKKYPDYKIVNLDKLTYAGNLDNLKDIENSSNYTFVKGDICDRGIVDELSKDVEAIVNFAAQTHVDRSIIDAVDFIKTNIDGTYNLLEATKKHNLDRFIQISCYDEKTRALTTEGLKSYKELKEGDLVFSLNPTTQEIEAKPIEKIIVQHYEGDMVHFNNKRIDLLVTPNHNMFILSTNKKKLLIETAEKALKRSIFFLPEGHWVGKREEDFEINGHGRVRTKDLMYVLGIFIGDGFVAYQEKQTETKTGLARKEFLNRSRDRQSGKFKKIGKLGNRISTGHSYRIFFDIPENDKCRKRLEKTLNSLDVKYHCHKGKAGTHLYVTSKIFMELFAQCGQGAYNKRIPRWALDYSPEYLRYLLEGLMDSDGHDSKIYHTVSEGLVSDICELCIKLNLKPSIHERHTISFMNGRKIEGKANYIFVANTTKSISRHRNKIITYNGNIWCLKVKDNKNFLVERNGKFDFCGNTDEVYGSIGEGSFKETSPLSPSSPYAASKAAADMLVHSYWVTFNLPVIVARSSNNFGPYQYPEKIIPLFITNALENKPIPLYGDGMNVRDWLYVLDNCEAIDLVLHKGKQGETYNIGGGNELKNIDLTRMVLNILGKPESLIQPVKDRPGHDRRYSLDCSKIERELGWIPRFDFERALKETVKWYRDNQWWWRKLKGKE